MTVTELIQALSKYPGDAVVTISALKAIDLQPADTAVYYPRRHQVIISDY